MDRNDPESVRLMDRERRKQWRRWGPYLSERQWGTVREDYSADGDAWNYLTYEQARAYAYRWGEDGIAGFSDYRQRLCFAIAMWNGQDAFLKERLFGLWGGWVGEPRDQKNERGRRRGAPNAGGRVTARFAARRPLPR